MVNIKKNLRNGYKMGVMLVQMQPLVNPERTSHHVVIYGNFIYVESQLIRVYRSLFSQKQQKFTDFSVFQMSLYSMCISISFMLTFENYDFRH